MKHSSNPNTQKKSSLFLLLKPYKKYIFTLAALSIVASGLGLILPKFISQNIDAYIHQNFDLQLFLLQFGGVTLCIYVFTYLQNILQTFTAERVAKDVREKLTTKISEQSYSFIEKVTPSKLLTNITSDIDSVKMFVGQAISSLLSSIILLIGASALLLSIDWKLALAVLCIIPIIGSLFFFILTKVRILMKKSREVIDWLNKVINESILGAALIRVLHSEQPELNKFVQANTDAKNTGLQILRLFVSLVPIVTFVANIAVLTILILGGHFVIAGDMTLGDFAAFNSYLSLLIFPILIIGMMSNVISQASASYERISEVLEATDETSRGTIVATLDGNIKVENITLEQEGKMTLKNISFQAGAKSKTAIIGPTAAGKTQLLYLLTGLLRQNSGNIYYDNHLLETYQSESLHRQIGFVFQESVIFNLSLRENIAFGGVGNEEDLNKAIETAELSDFVASLPQKLETIISERGASISGGQKQRIMLARALALNPKILLLDDFTARVDNKTEEKILSNLQRNYPELTLVSVTQKISSVHNYDNIILLMEGEIIAQGQHRELLATCPEYIQIYQSQKSTNQYE